MKRFFAVAGVMAFMSTLAFIPQDKKNTAAADTTPRLETLVPADTMGFFSIPDIRNTVKNYRQTVPGHALEYIFSSDFQNLLGTLGVTGGHGRRQSPDLRTQIEENLKKETGMSLDEILDIFTGEYAFAMIGLTVNMKPGQRVSPNPFQFDMVIKIGCRDTARGEQLIRTMSKKGPGIVETEISGFKIFSNKDASNPGHWAVGSDCLIFATPESRIKEILAAISEKKEIAKSLAKDDVFLRASKHIKKDKADAVFYTNWQAVMKIPQIQTFFTREAPTVLKDLGLDRLQSIAYSAKIEKARLDDILFLGLPKGDRRGIVKALSTPATETEDGIVLASSGDFGSLFTMYPAMTGMMAAVIVPSISHGMEQARQTSCTNNLRELHKGVILYMIKFGGPEKLAPDKTGPALWETLVSNPRDVFGGNLGLQSPLLQCPITQNHHEKGDYRGPAKPWKEMTQEDFIACDRPGNHPDGSICAVRKNSEVKLLQPGDPDYDKALEDTTED